MSGKVTAVGADVITERSGHVIAPVLPSVCVTPAAPSPIPVPYPATGGSGEGVVGAPSRTKVNGARIGTVGGAFKTTHGNEPGTMKEVVSHNTGGAAPLMLGAPIVLVELGMVGVTGSPVLGNKAPGGTTRTAPAPTLAPTPGMAAGTVVLGGGGGDGSGSGDGAGGDGSGGGDGAGNGNGAPSGQEGQCSAGHPVDVVTGRAYTLPAVDLELPGPLPFVWSRVYSTTAADRDVGLGFGWSHSLSWEIEVRRHAIVVWSDEGIATHFPMIAIGAEHVGQWGWALWRERDRLVLDKGDGLRRVFAAVDDDARRWKLIEVRDRNGNRIELTYDEAGRLVEITDSAERTIAVLSTREGRISSIQIKNARALGRWLVAARYRYDEAGNLAAAVDAEGHIALFAYDTRHRLARETDRCGLSFFFAYDRAGRCVETWGEYPGERDQSLADDVPELLADDSTAARGVHHVRLDYHDGLYTEVADSTQIRRYFGNAHGLVDKRVDAIGIHEALYDSRGLVVAIEDGEQAVTRTTRDVRGRVVMVIDPLGRATNYVRDEHGDVVRLVDPTGGTYELARDERGNVVHEADPTGATTSYTYDERGLVTSITSPTGAVTRLVYDDAGNLVEQVDPNGARWCWAHDPLGRVTMEVDPLGSETRWTWTARGDVAAVFDAAGGVTRYTYDGERHATEVHGPGERRIQLTWAGFGKLVAETRPDGATVRYRYNREGELTEVQNELGELHHLIRNAGGLVVEEQTFDCRMIRYRRDRAGRVVRATIAGGEDVEHAYNKAGELISRTYDETITETFEHDVRGELVRVTWPRGEIRFQRDGAGRVTREAQSLDGEADEIVSIYDATGARVRRSTSRGHVEHVDRDGLGARARTILDELYDVHHARDQLGRETMRLLPRGGRIHRQYDPLGRLARRWSTAPGGLLPVRFDDPAWTSSAAPGQPARLTAEREYKYSTEGELSDALDRRRGWVQYDYDTSGRLLSVVHEKSGAAERFTYDAAGNHYEAGSERLVREYGRGGRIVRQGETTYGWDAAGRLADKREGTNIWRYQWDEAGRLAGATLPDGRRVAYSYDPFGRRVETRTYQPATPVHRERLTERTRLVWDGDTIAHEIRTRADANGDPIVEERTYCFEDDSFAPWAQCDDVPDGYGGRSRTWSFFGNDPIGTPEELIGGDGTLVAELDRRAWGRTEAVDGDQRQTPLRFQGQREDQETTLFYNRFRYYDPDTGLYINPDPVGLDGGLRLYGYGYNPIGWIDPLGLTHYAKATVIRGGTAVHTQHLQSGNMTPAEKAIGWPKGNAMSHTEARACQQIPLSPGDTMVIHGQNKPCGDCKHAMNVRARETGATILYHYPGTGESWWVANAKRKKVKK